MARHDAEPDSQDWPWDDAADADIYQGIVRRCLWDPELSQYYGLRLRVSPGDLWSAAHEPAFVRAAAHDTRDDHERYRRTTDQLAHSRARRAAADAQWAFDGPLKAATAVLVTCLLWWAASRWQLVRGLPGPDGHVVTVGLLLAGLAVVGPAGMRRRVRAGLQLLRLRRAVHRQQRQLADDQYLWRQSLETQAVLPGLHRAAQELLGPEWAHFLSGGSFDGLREPHNPAYLVTGTAEVQLKQRMNQIGGGTIAVCGPRGTGKTTLLRLCSTDQQDDAGDLTVFVSAPAEYNPHEFLLTLFDELCARYLKWSGAGEPDLDVFRPRRRRRLALAVTAGLHWLRTLLRLALAMAALAVGVFPVVRWLQGEFLSPEDVAVARRGGTDLWAIAVRAWEDHPWVTGFLLVWLGLILLPPLRPARRSVTSLDDICVRHLARLRTVQSTTTGWTLALPQLLGAVAGATGGRSVSSVPFTFPELVAEYREVLTRIADEATSAGGRVVIAIDELDRLGDTQTARKFLGQIKAVFGVGNVYYLVSVAEDVGAAFARRSLPHRDATDSSIDDTFYVPPRTAGESEQILARRASGLGPPFVLLAHVLSGGIPRDLVRYARRLAESQGDPDHRELQHVTRRVIQEELANTLEGFRTLLALGDAGPEGGPLMHRLHALVRALHPTHEVTEGDVEFRLRELLNDSDEGALRQEIVVCAYFALTLLQVFGRTGFEERRRQARSKGPDGELERLAEARRELAVSTYSAHMLLDRFRASWDLPLLAPPAV